MSEVKTASLHQSQDTHLQQIKDKCQKCTIREFIKVMWLCKPPYRHCPQLVDATNVQSFMSHYPIKSRSLNEMQNAVSLACDAS